MHNAVNEQSWQSVMAWEKMLHAGFVVESVASGVLLSSLFFFSDSECEQPRLKRFSGDATAITPKARVRSWFGYTLPFDRHDWIVDRCGKVGICFFPRSFNKF